MGSGSCPSLGFGWSRGPQSPSELHIYVGVEFAVFRMEYFSNYRFNPGNQTTYHGINSLRKGPHKNATLDFSLLLARLKKLEKEILFR